MRKRRPSAFLKMGQARGAYNADFLSHLHPGASTLESSGVERRKQTFRVEPEDLMISSIARRHVMPRALRSASSAA